MLLAFFSHISDFDVFLPGHFFSVLDDCIAHANFNELFVVLYRRLPQQQQQQQKLQQQQLAFICRQHFDLAD